VIAWSRIEASQGLQSIAPISNTCCPACPACIRSLHSARSAGSAVDGGHCRCLQSAGLVAGEPCRCAKCAGGRAHALAWRVCQKISLCLHIVAVRFRHMLLLVSSSSAHLWACADPALLAFMHARCRFFEFRFRSIMTAASLFVHPDHSPSDGMLQSVHQDAMRLKVVEIFVAVPASLCHQRGCDFRWMDASDKGWPRQR
jgi:hypothetical protein